MYALVDCFKLQLDRIKCKNASEIVKKWAVCCVLQRAGECFETAAALPIRDVRAEALLAEDPQRGQVLQLLGHFAQGIHEAFILFNRNNSGGRNVEMWTCGGIVARDVVKMADARCSVNILNLWNASNQ